MDEIWLAVRWYLAMQVFAVAALPLCLRLFRRLPDRGYGLSKALGLLVGGWVFWILGTAGIAHNTSVGVLVAAAVVAAAAWLPAIRNREGLPAPSWRLVLTLELLFAVFVGDRHDSLSVVEPTCQAMPAPPRARQIGGGPFPEAHCYGPAA